MGLEEKGFIVQASAWLNINKNLGSGFKMWFGHSIARQASCEGGMCSDR